MPIYKESYESWQGQPRTRPRTWLVIGSAGIRMLWTKGMIFFLFLAWIPFLVKAVQIYLMTKLGQNAALAARAVPEFNVNPQFFLGFLQGQMIYLVLILVFAGTGLIARDKKFKAFSLYFSKPVSLSDYLAGKFMVIGFYSSLITIVPGLLLFLTRILLSQDTLFFKTYYWIPFSLLAASLVIIVSLGSLALACSAAAGGVRSAAIIFFGIITFPELLRLIFPGIKSVGLLSVQADFRQINALLFQTELPYAVEPWLSALLPGLLVLLCLLVLRRTVKPVEVIK